MHISYMDLKHSKYLIEPESIVAVWLVWLWQKADVRAWGIP